MVQQIPLQCGQCKYFEPFRDRRSGCCQAITTVELIDDSPWEFKAKRSASDFACAKFLAAVPF